MLCYISIIKSQAFEFVTNPILEVEDEETQGALREARYAEDSQPVAKKLKIENKGQGHDGGLNVKDSFQRMLVNSTYAGLEDLLVTKVNSKKAPSVLYANDEVSSLLSALDKDPTFDSNFLSLYTAKVSVMANFYLSDIFFFKVYKVKFTIYWLYRY